MLIIGHRGAKGLAPENTLASLQSALDSRVGMIEVDVRVSADGTPVLHHDSVLTANDGRQLLIEQTNFSDLQLAKTDLLTLEAALQFIDRRCDMMIEIKPAVRVGPIIGVLKPRLDRAWTEHDLVIASSDYHILREIRALMPDTLLAIIEKWSGVRAGWRAKHLRTDRLIMNHRWLWSGFIRSMARRGYKLSAYTLNNSRRARRFEKYGLYGCITDNPQKFLSNYKTLEN